MTYNSKVIFLDYDGVLTTPASDYVFMPECLERLGKILSNTQAKIVISSSRRGLTLEDTLESITDPNNPHVRNVPFPFTEDIIGITPHTIAWLRGQQIEAYLEGHPEVKAYVILDDENKFLAEQQKHLVLTNEETGLSESDVHRAIEILSHVDTTD